MPGISHKRLRNFSKSTMPVKLILQSHTARARARMVSARAGTSPMPSIFASARTSGCGKSRVSPFGAENGFPNLLIRRPASVVAPLTVTCCPRIARVASSNPSQHPGMRRPGSFPNLFANNTSFCKVLEIEAQSALRSNIFRIRSTTMNRNCGSPISIRATNSHSRPAT